MRLEEAGLSQVDLLQKHTLARATADALQHKNKFLSSDLEAAHAKLAGKVVHLAHALALLFLLWRVTRRTIWRNTTLVEYASDLQDRMTQVSIECGTHKDRFQESKSRNIHLVKSEHNLRQTLRFEQDTANTLREETEKLLKDLDNALRDKKNFKEIAYTLASRYDKLHTAHGTLLSKYNYLKGDCTRFFHEFQRIGDDLSVQHDLMKKCLRDLDKSVTSAKNSSKQYECVEELGLPTKLQDLSEIFPKTLSSGSTANYGGNSGQGESTVRKTDSLTNTCEPRYGSNQGTERT